MESDYKLLLRYLKAAASEQIESAAYFLAEGTFTEAEFERIVELYNGS